MPYLAFGSTPRDSDDHLFIVYVNTHSGTVPQWDLTKITSLADDRGREMKAAGWEVLYEDGQKHHRQGILTFSAMRPANDAGKGTLELAIQPPGMKKRLFSWTLPIPPIPPADSLPAKNQIRKNPPTAPPAN